MNTDGPIDGVDLFHTTIQTEVLESAGREMTEMREMIEQIRESQLRVEKLVTDFMADLPKNPMFAMFGKMFR